jgi:SpoVK/Ycf46/Vps4 family AAA+-type ATPase
LRPGYYDLSSSQGQLYFVPVRAREDPLLEFPDSAAEMVLHGIIDFWNKEAVYRKFGLPYKRGVLLWGPPGAGKTSCMQLVAREVVARGGIVLTFSPSYFLDAYRAFRDIQPETHLLVLMEDFESMIRERESRILNILDGVELLDRVTFLASSNFPERLEARIINRPSRFDICVKIGHPDSRARQLYLETLVHQDDAVDIDVARYVRDTETMSLAHIKELFIATVVLGVDYSYTLRRLKTMGDKSASSVDDESPNATWGSFL